VRLKLEKIEIIHGLPAQFRLQVAEIYYDAFRQKIIPLVRSQEKGINLLQQLFNAQHALIAMVQDKCVGVAGLHYDDQYFVEPKLSVFVHELGGLRGIPGYLFFHAFEPTPSKEKLHIECLAVSSTMCGKGIGSLLLKEIIQLAGEKRYHKVCLEVVDTNPDAQRLYERQGFTVTSIKRYPYLRKIVGFSAQNLMEKEID
jgi:ribosomal protein S18 acetylase RimI-like enzyme